MGNIFAQLSVVFYGFIEQKLLSSKIRDCLHSCNHHIPRVHKSVKSTRTNLDTLQVNDVVQRIWGPACCEVFKNHSQQQKTWRRLTLFLPIFYNLRYLPSQFSLCHVLQLTGDFTTQQSEPFWDYAELFVRDGVIIGSHCPGQRYVVWST